MPESYAEDLFTTSTTKSLLVLLAKEEALCKWDNLPLFNYISVFTFKGCPSGLFTINLTLN